MIDAAQAALLVTAQEQGSQAMGAVLVQQAHPAVGVPEGHQVLPQQPNAHGRAVGFGQFR